VFAITHAINLSVVSFIESSCGSCEVDWPGLLRLRMVISCLSYMGLTRFSALNAVLVFRCCMLFLFLRREWLGSRLLSRDLCVLRFRAWSKTAGSCLLTG